MKVNNANIDKTDHQKKTNRPKVSLRAIFRFIALKKATLFGPIDIALVIGCFIGVLGYYSLATLYYLLPHVLFAVLVGPLVIALLFFFVLGFCFCLCIKIRRFSRKQGVVDLRSEEDKTKDFIAKKSIVYSSLIRLIYIKTFLFVGQFLPPELFTEFIKFLGAKIGKNAHIDPGIIMDPDLVEIGENTTIGTHALISGHIEDRLQLAVKRVKIGKNCLVGGRSIIFPGVVMEDNVKVGAGAIVLENTYLPANSVWVGVPAKMIKNSKPDSK
jgi:acetyltransferase-like isoleucine patch superfamily enzyme